MPHSIRVTHPVVRSLLAAACASLASCARAETAAVPLDSVVVTGSAIRSTDLANENPITIISRRDIDAASATTLQELLQRVSAVGFQGLTSNQNSIATANGTGNEFVDLRNLGPARTLVLVDGKRLTPSGNVTSEGVDVGAIALSLVERIEILRDGATSIYGSDAIAGVINVILRKDFSGIDGGIGGGRTTHDDGTRRHVEATVGRSGSWGNLTFNTQFDKNDPIQQRDRDWSRNRVLDIEPNGTLTVTRNPGGIATFASPGFTDPASGRRSTRWIADGGGAYHPYGTADRFDLSTGSQLTVGQERIGANLLGSLKLTDDVEAYTRILYNHRKSTTEKNGATLGSTPVTLKYPNGFLVPSSAVGNPFNRALTLSKVFEQLGDQTGETDSGNLQALVGLRGSIAQRFAWDASFSDGRVRETFRVRNALNFTHAEQEVGQVPCTAADVARGCVAGDMFGPSSLSPAALDYLRYTSVSHAVFTQRAFESSITGDLFDLPYGPAAGALGTAWRRLSGRFDPDSVTLAGDQQGADTAPTAGSYDAKELFAELKLPLLARLPGIRELDATFATRYAHYSNAGGHVTWKAAVDWKVNDDVRFRTSHSTGLRAPSISELFLGKTSVSAAFNDPCDATAGQRSNPVVAANCAAAGVPSNYAQPTNNYNTLLGGNAKLRPETSSNWNIGMVVTPTTIPGLAVTVDYWNIHLRDAIGALNPTTILQTCYASPGSSDPLCGLIGPRGTILGNLTTLTDLEANQGRIRTDGLDLNAAYTFPLRAIAPGAPGKITLQANGTLTFNNRQQLTAGGPEVQLAGTVDQPTSSTNPGAIPRIRYGTSVEWANDANSVRLGTRYIGPVHALGQDRSIANNRTAAITYTDLAATWKTGPLLFVAGVDNLFNRRPPFYDDGTVNTSEYTYDLQGRFFYLKAKVRF